jgi:hypothetical protein
MPPSVTRVKREEVSRNYHARYVPREEIQSDNLEDRTIHALEANNDLFEHSADTLTRHYKVNKSVRCVLYILFDKYVPPAGLLYCFSLAENIVGIKLKMTNSTPKTAARS